MYKHIRESWEQGKQQRQIQWRRENVTVRCEHPSRLDRARALGYRAKQGIFVVRQRVFRGGHRRMDWDGGRHSSNMSIRMNLRLNYQAIAERRANDVYPNCEVLNSYEVGKDGKHAWYEVILVDKDHPVIKADHRLNWMSSPSNRSRAFRGLTSSQRKTRGLRIKGKGAEHMRPSRNAR